MVQVSLSTSTNYDGELNALVEDLGTALTVSFSLDQPAPSGGLKVYVDSDVEQIVNRLNLPGFGGNPIVENINPSLLGTNFDNSGFFLTIDEGSTNASFTIDVFDNSEPDTFLPATFDGLVEAVFSLKTNEQVDAQDLGDVGNLSDYTIDSNAATSTVLFADSESQLTEEPPSPTPEPNPTPEPTPGTGLPLVSLNTGPDYLVEADGTVSAHVFNVTGATIPEGGIVVGVNAPNLSEFNLDAISVADGGEIVNVREDGFDIRLTDFTVLVDLPVAADGEAEGLETASFSLVAGDGYEVNEDFSSGEFTLVDTADEIPDDALNQRNDILPLAVPIELSEDDQTTLTTTINFDIGNRYLNDDGTYTYIDATEDVDFYSFELEAGDIISIDGDSWQRGEPPAISDYEFDNSKGPFIGQRIFDSEGNELAATWLGQGPGELFVARDSYLEFEAPESGTYYLGISDFLSGAPDSFVELNEFPEGTKYDPFVPGSGNNQGSLQFDAPRIGEYDLTIDLNPETILELPQFASDGSANTNPGSDESPESNVPAVSLDFMGFTVDPETDDLTSPYLTEGTARTNSAFFLAFETEGEIPEEGILVNVNSDNYLRQYIARRSFFAPPFSPGAELENVIFDETGRETGFQLRIFEPYTFVTFNAQSEGWADIIEPDVEAPEDVTWFVEPGEGYTVNSDNNEITATYYDPDQLPEPEVIPEIEISISESELIESEGTATTLTFTLSEPPPEEGVIIQVNGSSEGILPQFDVFNLEIDGGVFPSPNFDFSGFFFKITDQVASITLPVFEDPFDEGLQSYTFSLQEASNYTIASNAGEAEFTIADNPDSVVEVSLSSDSETLVETENPTGILTFNLTAEPPAEGVTANVNADNLSEFDVDALTVTGGEITEITDSGFSINITSATATVELPVLAEGEAEGAETATFSLAETRGSTINPDTNEAVITLYDNPDQVPVTEEAAENDTIAQALDLNLNPENDFNATVRGGLFHLEPEQGFTEENDYSEDVDFYTFDLEAGETVKVDVDAVGELNLSLYEGVDLRLDSELRLFDAEGNELASVNNAPAPDEEFSRDPYLEFTAEEAGSYVVGVSQLGNNNYDPNVEGSGSGWIFPEIGVFTGEYDLNVSLTSGNVAQKPTNETVFGSLKADIIEVSGTSQLIFGGDSDDLIDASISSQGNNRIYAGSGDDTLILGSGDRLVGGEGADKFFALSDGDNILTGGEGADQFWIATAEIPDSANIITDFTSGEDVLGIAGLGIGFDDLSITGQDDNTLIAANNSELAILQGIGVDSLIADNFAFA